MKNLAKYIPPPSKKGGEYDQAYWIFPDKYLCLGDINVATRDGLPESVQNYIDGKYKNYISFPQNILLWPPIHNGG